VTTDVAAAETWETVIGLEVHCELQTRTKLFCGCRNAFGDEPNTNVCAVCLGLPGSLPVLNRKAVELAMRIGAAVGSEVRPSLFHRKNYFYPDMPKDYQISQYDEPINEGGRIALADGTSVGITRAHLEEDTGKTSHVGEGGRIHGADHSLVDYNRAGVPLVEIVSEPDIRSPEQAKAYVSELRGILLAVGASDARMEEGSLRVDANVSVRRAGSSEYGTRAEIKNLNSLRSLGRALEYEVRRQVELLESGDEVVQETRHWDEDAGRTSSMRSKEEAYDYRYFPEPDLVPVAPGAEWQSAVRAGLGKLPSERRDGLAEAAGMAPADVALAVELDLDGLVLSAIEAGADARLAVNRAVNELAGMEGASKLDSSRFAALLELEAAGRLSATQSKQVLGAMIHDDRDPAAIADERGFRALDADALTGAVDAAIAAHPDEWQRLRGGQDKLVSFFVGKVMAATKGQADGKAVTALLRERAS
jgi:aspartyl-tRNA(Asn)/glutamyl-tRNA(Gln) amidotransferase subunit B